MKAVTIAENAPPVLAQIDEFVQRARRGEVDPFVVRLAEHLGVAKGTVYEWADKFDAIRCALADLKAIRAERYPNLRAGIGGRKSTMTPEKLDTVREFVQAAESGQVPPHICRLAKHLGASVTTVRRWATESQEVAEALDGLKSIGNWGYLFQNGSGTPDPEDLRLAQRTHPREPEILLETAEILWTADRPPYRQVLDPVERQVVLTYPFRKQIVTLRRSFPAHGELSNMMAFIRDVTPTVRAARLSSLVDALEKLTGFMLAEGWSSLTPESFMAFLRWLRESHWNQETERVIAGCVLRYAEWLYEDGQISGPELRSMKKARTQEFKGSSARKAKRRIDEDAVGPEELVRLYHAIRLLMDEVRGILGRGDNAEIAAYHPRLPLLPFPLLLGIEHALRSKEYTYFRYDQIGSETITVRAPDKQPRRLLFDQHSPELREAWLLARAWQDRYRTTWRPDEHPLYTVSLRTANTGQLIPFVGNTFDATLSFFYEKFYSATGTSGDPVLFKVAKSEDGTETKVPFDLPWAKYRHASGTHFARIEPDPRKLMKFMGHSSPSTAEMYYIRQRWQEWQEKVAAGLRIRSERMNMLYVAAQLSPEDREQAKAMHAEVAASTADGRTFVVGACGKSLEAGVLTCPMELRDCRLCPFVRIDPDLRDVYVEMAECDLAHAEACSLDGNHRGAEVAEAMAAVSLALIVRIDEWKERRVA